MRRRSPLVALIALAACVYGLWVILPDLRFALEGAPRDLPPAAPGDGRHVRVQGAGEPLGFRVELSGDTRDAWLLPERRLIVLLPAGHDEPRAGDLAATGRLYRGDRARGWHPAAAAVASRRGGDAADYWILVAGEAPGTPWGSLGIAALLLGVLALNVRWLHLWWRGRKAVAPPQSAE